MSEIYRFIKFDKSPKLFAIFTLQRGAWFVDYFVHTQVKIPKIKGLIKKPILIDSQIEREVLGNYLPKLYRSKVIKGRECNIWNSERVFESFACVSKFCVNNGSIGLSTGFLGISNLRKTSKDFLSCLYSYYVKNQNTQNPLDIYESKIEYPLSHLI